MDFTRKASITVTASISAAEIVRSARTLIGFEALILGVAQAGAETGGSAAGLTLVARTPVFAADGSATVDLVYEKVETSTPSDAGDVALQGEQLAAQETATQPVVPLSLQMPGAAPAAA